MILTTAALCLAANVYYESRGELFNGQIAVAQVTLNRAQRHPKNVCDVVTRSKQFSWTIGRVKRQHGKYVVLSKFEPKDKQAWLIAQAVAKITLMGWSRDITHGAMFYHTAAVSPAWDRNMKVVTVIGRHIFYKV